MGPAVFLLAPSPRDGGGRPPPGRRLSSLSMRHTRTYADRIGTHGRTILAFYPESRYPVSRLALEGAFGEIVLTADGSILDRFASNDLLSAMAAFREVDPGRLSGEVVEVEEGPSPEAGVTEASSAEGSDVDPAQDDLEKEGWWSEAEAEAFRYGSSYGS